MNGYSVKVQQSSKQLTPREKLMCSDTTNAVKLDDVVKPNEPYRIEPESYCVLAVHNESADNNKDYNVYLIFSTDGTKYVTGSESFWNSFSDIWETMHEEDSEEKFAIECYKIESKNYKGKFFLTCSII